MSSHPGRGVVAAIELFVLTALILVPRCANYQQVFIAGNVYFTDADCYSRMTRVRMCLAHPGLVLRHHDFENFPEGTTPHTTVPFDYLTVALSVLLAHCTSHSLDLAGALISPLLALLGAWFLWWWARRMKFRYRWPMLILFAVSPILVHGTELGRPDHQSLLIVLIVVALCAEWCLLGEPSRNWGMVAGCAWGVAFWVSLYEPLILFVLVLLASLLLTNVSRARLFIKPRSAGWLCFLFVIMLALLMERRVPSLAGLAAEPFVRNWTHNIGELQPVPFFSKVWFRWAGCLVAVTPLLLWWSRPDGWAEPDKRRRFVLFLGLLGGCLLLTMWQARWGYFFVAVFVIVLPALLEAWRSRVVVWMVFALSLWPMADEWEGKLWPNETELTRLATERMERMNLHELGLTMISSARHPFLAPWWLSPALAYWSQQPGVAGSSHESIAGIVETARFYATTDSEKAREITEKRRVSLVVAYDADRTAESSGQILGQPVAEQAFCYLLGRASSSASPGFLVLAAQNPAARLFRVTNNR